MKNDLILEDFYPKACESFNFLYWRIVNDVIDLSDTDGSVTEKQIKDKAAELLADWESQAYARNRRAEYDALNQFEMQFDDDANGTTTWKDAIDAIKAKWPKDNSGPVYRIINGRFNYKPSNRRR